MVDEKGPTRSALLMADASYRLGAVALLADEYHMVPSRSDRDRACLKRGLILYRDADGPGVIWVRGSSANRDHARRDATLAGAEPPRSWLSCGSGAWPSAPIGARSSRSATTGCSLRTSPSSSNRPTPKPTR